MVAHRVDAVSLCRTEHLNRVNCKWQGLTPVALLERLSHARRKQLKWKPEHTHKIQYAHNQEL